MRILNDSNGAIDGRVALTITDASLLVIALEALIARAPVTTSALGGESILSQLDAIIYALKQEFPDFEGGEQCG